MANYVSVTPLVAHTGNDALITTMENIASTLKYINERPKVGDIYCARSAAKGTYGIRVPIESSPNDSPIDSSKTHGQNEMMLLH